MSERGGEIASQPQHLAEESVRAVQGFESVLVVVGEQRFQTRLSVGHSSQVGARQRPPDSAEGGGGGTPERLPQLGVLRELGQGPLGDRARGIEVADPEVRVRQHGAHFEREPRVVGSFGELSGSLRTDEVLCHVAGEPAQAAVGREQERVTCPISQSLDERAGLLEKDL